MTARLSSSGVLRLPHGELEELVQEEGREILRSLLQDHLDLRGAGRVVEPVVGADDIDRTHVRVRDRKLATIVGRVEVDRAGYLKPGTSTLYPMDAELNLPEELYSHGIRKRVAIEASKSSYQETVQTVAALTGETVGARQAEELVDRAAHDFDAFYEDRELAAAAEENETAEILVLSVDQKGIVMRHQDLREATRRAAERRKHKLSKRLSKGEKANSKRMSTVATVYTIDPFKRAPEDIVSELRGVEELQRKLKRPRPENKRVWASVEKEAEEVVEAAIHEGLRRDPVGKKTWVVVVDGAEKQLELIQNQAAAHDVTVIIVLDLIHVIEYLWKAVTAFHPEGTREAESWVTQRLYAILSGNASHVAAGMRRSATLRGLPPEKRKNVDVCANYLLKYSPYLRYDEYLAKGLPIASGVIEGACRHLVKDRLDITGARWGLKGAEAILKLRSLRSSGDFDEYWTFHLANERRRNHDQKYRAGRPPFPSSAPSQPANNRPRLKLVH